MPVAQKSGKLLAQRLNYRAIHTEGHYLRAALRSKKMDYDLIPTTVFSPTEYSFVGLSEAEAHQTYSEEDVEIYHSETTPL
jgi:thioredoxin reductase (NADPH)